MVADRWAALLDGQSEGGFAPARTSALSSAVMLAARAKWILTRQAFQAEGDVSEAMTHKLSHWGTPIGPEPIVEPHGLIADVDGNPVAALRPSQWRRRPSRLALRFMATRLGNPKSARLSSHRFPSSCVPTQPCPALGPICSGSQGVRPRFVPSLSDAVGSPLVESQEFTIRRPRSEKMVRRPNRYKQQPRPVIIAPVRTPCKANKTKQEMHLDVICNATVIVRQPESQCKLLRAACPSNSAATHNGVKGGMSEGTPA